MKSSQVNYVRRPSPEKLTILSQLIAIKIAEVDSESFIDLYIDEAIEVASNLTCVEMDILSYIYATDVLTVHAENYLKDVFIPVFEIFYQLNESIKGRYAQYNRLVYYGALTTSAGVQRGRILIENFPQVFHRAKKQDFPNEFKNALIPNEIINNDGQRCYGVYNDKVKKVVEPKQYKKLEEFTNNLTIQYAKYKESFEAVENFNTVFLTYLGVIISMININNKFGTDFDIVKSLKNYYDK